VKASSDSELSSPLSALSCMLCERCRREPLSSGYFVFTGVPAHPLSHSIAASSSNMPYFPTMVTLRLFKLALGCTVLFPVTSVAFSLSLVSIFFFPSPHSTFGLHLVTDSFSLQVLHILTSGFHSYSNFVSFVKCQLSFS